MSDFETNFQQVLTELEALNETFTEANIPAHYFETGPKVKRAKLWSVPRSTGELLRALVLIKQPKLILELGTSAGYSTLWLAAGARAVGAKVVTLEWLQLKIDMAAGFFNRADLTSYIEQIQGRAHEVLGQWDRPIDFLFLDVDKPRYAAYLQMLEPHLKPGAVIVADDTTDFKDRMTDYYALVNDPLRYHTQALSLDHGLLISVKI